MGVEEHRLRCCLSSTHPSVGYGAVIDALWYVAAGSEFVRHVVARGFPGHERDDVFVSTDPELSPRAILSSFARRWSPNSRLSIPSM
jgi:hypothetical protein